jgi:alpha-tubulin suppressor-like RCC1 family protein
MKRLIIINLALLLFCSCTKDFCPISGELSTGSITKVRNTAAVANVTVATNSLTKEIGVLYSTSSTPDYTNALKTKYDDLSNNGKNISLTGLTAGTLYYYRAYATDGANYVYGDIKTFTTTNYKIIAIAAGAQHSLAIDETGTLWAWGFNNCGQYGDGTTNTSSRPVLIKGGTKFKAIAATTEANYSLAIDESGNLWFWGADPAGDNQYETPLIIMPNTKFKTIAGGLGDLFAIDESGNLWGLGSHYAGSIGDGIFNKTITPVQVKNGTKFKAVAPGGRHFLAIDESGNLWAWGDNWFGVLGCGLSIQEAKDPIQIMPGTKFKAIAASGGDSFAIDESGNSWAWGECRNDRLGFESDMNKQIIEKPIQTGHTGPNYKTITPGFDHALALDELGHLWLWGSNSDGQLGLSKTSIRTEAKSFSMNVYKAISAGPYTSFAIDEFGRLWGWGNNSYNVIGSSLSQSMSPVQIDQF